MISTYVLMLGLLEQLVLLIIMFYMMNMASQRMTCKNLFILYHMLTNEAQRPYLCSGMLCPPSSSTDESVY
ncbi:hypothetical protein RchiOBHm_Chr1g0330411 [Rosa chinensis]|uniref:Uncharacterized protein n=1 Tax=Rosa chinensis TaxID=74649 RepID=A0A2P6SBB7_ROSCH|nr:hypothetical protein RchiOBHm_Chr1g0330411 [Rosa chinensis]